MDHRCQFGEHFTAPTLGWKLGSIRMDSGVKSHLMPHIVQCCPCHMASQPPPCVAAPMHKLSCAIALTLLAQPAESGRRPVLLILSQFVPKVPATGSAAIACLPVLVCRGTVTVAILIIFYTAPLSVLAEVFATRSSATLYMPFAIMNLVSSLRADAHFSLCASQDAAQPLHVYSSTPSPLHAHTSTQGMQRCLLCSARCF
jgi:hypothetical protein